MTTVTTLATRGAPLYIGGDARLLGERGGAAGAFAAEAALSFLRGVMQRPRHGSHDVHGDGPGVVADKGDLAVALVGRAVNSMLPGLAAKAADLVSGGWREAAANVLVEEHLHAVALDKEGVVVISPFALRPQPTSSD